MSLKLKLRQFLLNKQKAKKQEVVLKALQISGIIHLFMANN